ncbi:MAG: peptidase M48 family protein [Alphaproteobacteria bacterium]|nr:peptidase M48 family protein [Alphaproteobacteria bacterium]
MFMKCNIMNLTRFFFLLAACVSIIVTALIPRTAKAQTVIRDTELEENMKVWSSDLIRAAGLSPENVNFVFVQDSQINAFVAGGQNIFIYTGLINETDNLSELLGVIAHELGHISGGHLIRTKDAMENASYESILGMVLGIGAAVLSGNGGAASAIGAASQSSAMSGFLSHSRVQESTADQAGISYLRTAGIDAKGMETFLEKMIDQELLPQTNQLEYVRTHPLSRNRLSAIENKVKDSPSYGKGVPEAWQREYAMTKAKLIGFISPERVIWDYSDRDQSMPAKYARAIAQYRKNQLSEALSSIDGLIAADPDNPYYYELKGQALSESGRVEASLVPYKKSVELDPDAGLIRMAYAHALIESARGNENHYRQAIEQLKKAQLHEKRSSRLHRLMATAYGRLNDQPRASLHLAEEAMLLNQKDYARSRVEGALKGLERGSGDWYRAQDILNVLDNS